MKQCKGITLVALVITIILLLLLAGVTMNVMGEGGILGNAEKAVDMSKVSSVQNKIKLAIAKKMVVSDRSVDLEDIIEQLEKQGIVKSGDSNVEIGQVKTQPDGYVFEIKEKANGNWEVTYIGNGDIGVPEVIITLSKNTTGLTDEVVITMTAKADSGIANYTLPDGISQSVTSGNNEITKTYTATKNGTYEFTVVNGNGNSVSKSIAIDNILEETIEISANKTMPTTDDIIVTIKWPSDASKGVKQIQVEEGVWQTVTGATSQITVSQNCTVAARVTNSIGEISSASLSIRNIDKTLPTVIATEGTDIIDWQTDIEISSYFRVEANGTMDITSIEYMDTSNANVEINNTSTLMVGTHIIQCTATKETGAVSSTTKTILVEPLVFGNLYKISDTEYHLIFNGTGAIAQGYTEEQLVARGANIKDGSSGVGNSEGISISDQPWSPYSGNITKVKIEEEIKPRSTANYFSGLSQITEIEGMNYLDTSNVRDIQSMFAGCSNLINLDVSEWNISKVTDMNNIFQYCSNLETLDVSNWDTSIVTNMNNVFKGCSSLVNLDVSDWNTSSVTNMNGLFYGCSNLTNLDVSNWVASNVTGMSGVFFDCSGIEQLDLSNWDTAKVTNMFGMFRGCSNLTTIYAGDKWTTSAVTSSSSMFNICTNLKGAISYDSTKLDATYANWTTGYLTYKTRENEVVDANGLAKENTVIKPSTSSNVQIVIPKGFAPVILQGSGTTTSAPGQNGKVKSIMPSTEWNNITVEQINQGIVVVDHTITYTDGVPDFNEYVWVPIPDSSDFARVAWTSSYSGYSNEYGTHPLASSSTTNAFWETSVTAMVNSVNSNKGFYIGRYEASNDGNNVAQSKRLQTSWVSVSQVDAITYSASNPANNAHLIYGIEWDSVLNWLIGNAKITSSNTEMTQANVQSNSSNWGNYSNSTGDASTGAGYRHSTGYSEYWKACNIYDLAGNVTEMTQEIYSTGTYRVERGGYFDGNSDKGTAASRFSIDKIRKDSYARFPY